MTFLLGILCSELPDDRANCRKVSENERAKWTYNELYLCTVHRSNEKGTAQCNKAVKWLTLVGKNN